MTTTTPAFPTAGLTILDQAPAALRANPRNARTHSKKQIGKIADSIRAFGFTVPLVVDETGLVLAGHGRLMAAKQLGLPMVPTVRLDHLSETQKRAYAIADNRIATLAGWDRATLALELGELAIHLPELHAATCPLYGEQKNLIMWSKTNPGQGSLYRSQHELIALYKVGTASHTNNVELGRHGRNCSNVWNLFWGQHLQGRWRSGAASHRQAGGS